MIPEEITTPSGDDDAFAAVLKKAVSCPPVAPLPPGLSERIALATHARPSLWSKLALVLSPAPARFALGGALTAAALCAVFLPRVTPPQLPKAPTPTSKPSVSQDTPAVSVAPSPAPTTQPGTQVAVAPPTTVVVPTPAPRETAARATANPVPAGMGKPLGGNPTPAPTQPTPAPERVTPSASTLKDDASIPLESTHRTADSPAAGTVNPEPVSRVGETTVAAAPRTGEKTASEVLPTPMPVSSQPVAVAARQSGDDAGLLDENGTLRTRPKRVKFNLGLSDKDRAALHKASQIDPLSANNTEPSATGSGLAFVRADVK